jgi:hypothetical protein
VVYTFKEEIPIFTPIKVSLLLELVMVPLMVFLSCAFEDAIKERRSKQVKIIFL